MSLYQEIHEQPSVIQRLLSTQRGQAERIAEAIRDADPRFAFLAARGTSDNAGRYANYLWGIVNGLPLALATPSAFTLYQRPPRLRDALVVGISQSGRSPDIVTVVQEGRKQGNLTLAITNAPDSPLAQTAEWVLDIQAGEERSVAATKTYTAQLAAVALLSATLAQDQTMLAALEHVPAWMQAMLALDETIAQAAQRYRYMDQCVVLGRGYNYATAFEWALKLKELTYIAAEPYSSADFQHGPVAVVAQGYPVLAVAPSGAVLDSMHDLLRYLHTERRAELVVISDDEEVLSWAQVALPLPQGVPEWLSPLVSIVAAQLFTYHLTQAKGYNTDRPRGLRKVT
ncbi:MAG: SIS domain-containing protein, partial [Chloroflexi bacterium]|nr:SIS domain-containing protein [Chloroflexota bacterium]